MGVPLCEEMMKATSTPRLARPTTPMTIPAIAIGRPLWCPPDA
jgi:hypothetical protein